MKKLRVLDLFSGIGGFSLGLERTGGFETVAFCEIEEFPRRVLKKHWPKVPCYEDVRTLTADVLARDGIAVDVITGGFPCQDLSVAGKQAGMGAGTRSGLWSEIIRLVGELRPQFVIVENVAALLAGPSEQPGRWFGRVLGDLAECGYDAEWENIPASALGAPHRRERVWIVAYPERTRPQRLVQNIGIPFSARTALAIDCDGSTSGWCRMAERSAPIRDGDGLRPSVDRRRVKSLGNAVVPQIPELIGRAILAARQAEVAQTTLTTSPTLAALPLSQPANSPTVSSPCRAGFLFGAVAGSAGQTPAVDVEMFRLKVAADSSGYNRRTATALTECATFHDAAVAAQGGM
jgi:DNA (cytosine-5)-methyltransferase 1